MIRIVLFMIVLIRMMKLSMVSILRVCGGLFC